MADKEINLINLRCNMSKEGDRAIWAILQDDERRGGLSINEYMKKAILLYDKRRSSVISEQQPKPITEEMIRTTIRQTVRDSVRDAFEDNMDRILAEQQRQHQNDDIGSIIDSLEDF